ncbi:MAG: helix-turn-helix domain-containing protein [Chloroflexi bacterium]|nr:MAG: helix-turn-helix domain-containing protein [Chloroflexota bacterium]
MDTQKFRTPGQYIDALLLSRGWSQRVLAIILGIDETGLNKIVSGKKAVDAKTALMLGDVFGVNPESFLELQKTYDLAKAKIETIPDPGRATRAHLFGGLPVTEMIKRGWLDTENIRDVPKVEAALTKFFGVSSVDEIEILPHAAKKTKVFSPATPVQIAWLYRVKEIASEMIVGRFSVESANRAIDSLKNLLHAPEETRKIPRILAECGIRYLIVETLPSAKIDGVCFWLDKKSPVVAMSLRYDRIDNFWFVLRHELEHVIQNHGQEEAMLDAELEGENAGTGDNISEEERIANEAATEFCVPKKKMDSFVARKHPFFKEIDILGFANTIHVHPGLIAGQLQHRTRRYDRFRGHLVKVRHTIAPSAMVDGWGDIAPVGL